MKQFSLFALSMGPIMAGARYLEAHNADVESVEDHVHIPLLTTTGTGSNPEPTQLPTRIPFYPNITEIPSSTTDIMFEPSGLLPDIRIPDDRDNKTKTGEVWIISEFQRQCVEIYEFEREAYCDFHFKIQQDVGSDAEADGCSFRVQASPGEHAFSTSFEGVHCEEKGASRLEIGSGWNPQGFIVLNIKDTEAEKIVFLGFTDDALEGITDTDSDEEADERDNNKRVNDDEDIIMPVQEVEVHEFKDFEWDLPDASPTVSSSTSTQSTTSTVTPIGEENGLLLVDAPAWKISNFARYHVQDKLLVGFFISSGTDGDKYYYIACGMYIDVPSDTPAWRLSFYDAKCSNANQWHISWGYDAGRDAAVLTVVNPERSRMAWFGWNNINSSWVLPDRGPNDTIEVK